jgi:predicted ATPase
MIERIAIDNFRCFVNFELRPGDINLILGSNGAGKSALIDALAAIQEIAVRERPIAEVLPKSSLTRWDKRRTQRFELDVRSKDGLYHYLLLVAHDDERDQPLIRQERLEKDSNILFRFDGEVHLHGNSGREGAHFPFTAARSFLGAIEERKENTDLMWFRDRFLKRLWLGRIDPTRMTDLADREDPTLARDASNFAAWYRHLTQESPETIDRVTESLSRVIPHFKHLRLSTHDAGTRRLMANFAPHQAETETRAGYELRLSELSDGQRSLLAQYTLLHATVPTGITLLIDEPDNFVSLAEIQPWLVELCDSVRGHGQVVFVSHHPEVINYLAPEARTFLFERPDGGPCRARPFPFDASGTLPSELILRGILS